MPASTNQMQALFDIATSIGRSLDLNKMLKESLSKIVRSLNCSAGGVLQLSENSNGEYGFRDVQTIPKDVDTVIPYQLALKELTVIQSDKEVKKLYKNLPVQKKVNGQGHYYFLPLPDFGILILVTGKRNLDSATLKSMIPVTEHLAGACLACLQTDKIEQSRAELAETNKQLITQGQVLKEREQELILLVESTLDSIFILSKSGTILYISPSIKELAGYDKEELLGRVYMEFVPQNELPRYQKKLKDIFQNRIVKHFETIINHKDGTPIPIEINGQLVRHEGKMVAQWTLRNISERKKFERVREKYSKDLEEAIQYKTMEMEDQIAMAESSREAILNILEDVMAARSDLKESESLYKDLYNNAPILYHTIDLEGNILECNEELLRQFDYERDEYVGHHITEFLTPEYRKKYQKTIKEIIKKGGMRKLRSNFRCKDGQIFHAELLVTVEKDEEGGAIALRGAIVNISDQIERERLEKQALIRTQLESKTLELTSVREEVELDLRDLLYKLADLYKEMLRAEAVVLFSYSKEKRKFINSVLVTTDEYMGDMKKMYPSFTGKMSFSIGKNKKMKEILNGDEPVALNNFNSLGTSKAIHAYSQIYSDHKIILIPLKPFGKPWGLLGLISKENHQMLSVINSIKESLNQGILRVEVGNERIKTQKELKRLAEFPTQNPLPVIEVNGEGIITFANKAVTEILNTLNETDKTPATILPKHFKTLVTNALKKGEDIEQTEVQLGGRNFLWIGHPLQKFDLVHFYATDITELKTIEKELIQAKERAEASDRLKNVFIGTISHEVRTPLNTILGYSDLLEIELKDKLSKEEKRQFDIIRKSGDRLKQMVDDVLDVSQIEADRIITKLKSVHADNLVLDSIREIEIPAQNKNLTISKDLKGSQSGIKVDMVRFHQAMGNILQNAVKYTQTGGVSVKTWVKKEVYYISVVDTGVGISKEFMPFIFALFRQQDEGYTRKYEGAGLGTYISHRFIRAMGGTIDVESTVGEGTTFTLSFPVAEKVFSLEKTKGDEELKKPIGNKKLFKHILILEDNPANLNYVEFLLKKLDIPYVSAETGEDALLILKNNSIDCMLVDISLRGEMSGVAFMKKIRQKTKYDGTPIIAMTAHTMKGMREKFINQGFSEHLPKPFTLAELKAILNKPY